MSALGTPVERYRHAYMKLREREGRGTEDLLEQPFIRHGEMAKQWQVHARTFRAFVARILKPLAQRRGGPLDVLDLGAGNGWLCYRVQADRHRPVAVDLRLDAVDGLAAAVGFGERLEVLFPRVSSTFEGLPFADRAFDLVVFASSLHCASDVDASLGEAVRVCRPGGRLAVLDSPFYRSDDEGRLMVEEREQSTRQWLPELADGLLALDSEEYLTREGLCRATASAGVTWRRHRVLYPLWYELRPLKAKLNGKRRPSRFDLWEGVVPGRMESP